MHDHMNAARGICLGLIIGLAAWAILAVIAAAVLTLA